MSLFSFSGPAWRPVADPDALLDQLSDDDDAPPLGPSTSAHERELPMYDSVRLVCLASDAWGEDGRVCFLQHGGRLLRLRGQSPPIHEVNAQAPIQLTEDDVLFYLSFFCLFVHGDEGPFYVLHDLEDDLLPDGFGDIEPQGKVAAGTPRHLFRRPRLFGRDDQDRWRASGLVFYGGALFAADFHVRPDGMVEMVEDGPLATELNATVRLNLTPERGGE